MKSLAEQWAEVYETLSLSSEFRAFHQRTPIMRPLHDVSVLWCIPVITGVTTGKIFEGFREKGVEISEQLHLSLRRDLVIDNSYLVYTDAGVNLPIRMGSSSDKLLGMISLQEYLLLTLWHLVIYNSCLDNSSATICSGTRLDGHGIPAVRYYSSKRVMEIGFFIGTPTDRHAPRLVYMP